MTKRSTKNQENAAPEKSVVHRPILDALTSAKTILVPNARAAELVRERYGSQMIKEGRRAWPSARIMPWRVWLADYYTRTNTDAPGLLSNEQALLVWEQVVSDEREFSLQQVSQFTRMAADAWANIHLWQIPSSVWAQKYPTFEVGLFAKWQDKFRNRCLELKVIDVYQAASDLLLRWGHEEAEAAGQPAAVIQHLLVGYADPPPLLKALGRYCWQIVSLDVNETPTDDAAFNQTLYAFESDTEELQSAIDWVVKTKLDNPDASVAIALSNPALMRHATKDGLRRYLYQCGDGQQREIAATIGLYEQQTLSQAKLVRSALQLLKLGEQISCDEATALLLDPYLGVWRADAAKRACVDRDIRNDVRDLKLTTQYFVSLVSREVYALQDFHARLSELLAVREASAHQQSLIEWLEQFERELEIMNWPAGAELTQDERAAKDAWQKGLDGFVSLSPFTGSCTRRHALHRLNNLLQQRVFNKPLGANCIRIIDFDEVPLLEADAIAWCGLGQHQWPKQNAINPLLPYAAQRDARLPGTNSGFDACLARNNFQRALSSVTNNLCSYTRLVEDVENIPVAGFATVNTVDSQDPLKAGLQAGLGFDEFEDEIGLPLAAEVSLRNAVRFFADQAACPFRAYAVHRLNSDSMEAPALGLDARRRGELVHLVVADLWTSLGSQQNLAAKTPGQVNDLISTIVDETVAEYRRESRQLPQYWEIEAKRLKTLLREWLNVEAKRQDFSVIDTEKSLVAEIAEFRFKVRIDRMDRLEDDSVAVIDFKTGNDPASSWATPRIEQPQLPIYAVNLATDNVSSIAYAQLRSGACRFVELPKAALTKGNRTEDWDEQITQWRHDLHTTAGQMAAGFAAVDPKAKSTCRYCEQGILCRIGDSFDQELPDSSDNDDGM